MVRTPVALALIALMHSCRDVRIEARCTVRPDGSFCTFHNTGSRRGEACFLVTVRRTSSDETFARARACSGPLAPGGNSAPAVLSFDNPAPFDRCAFDPSTGAVRDCETRVVADTARPL